MQALVLLPEWQCQSCTAGQKLSRGCEEPATRPVELDGEKMTRCPRRIMLDEPQYVNEIWWLYSRYRDGMLPEHGGLYDQPAKYLAVVRLLESVQQASNSEKEERDQRRQASQAAARATFGTG